MGMRTGTGAHTNGVQIGNEHRGAGDDCRAIKEALAFDKNRNRVKGTRVGTLRA